MIQRLAIASALALALSSCASYDAGYRQGYADRNRHVDVDVDDGAPIGYGDYDVVRNGYYGGYGYPYEYARYGFDSSWQPGFGFGPWFYQPWYGYVYPYGWYYPRHHHRGHHPPSIGTNWTGISNQQTHVLAMPANPSGSAGVGRPIVAPHPVSDSPSRASSPRMGIPAHERGYGNEPSEPRPAPHPRPHR